MAVPFTSPDDKTFPSGENATHYTHSGCFPILATHEPLEALHNRRVLSLDAEAM